MKIKTFLIMLSTCVFGCGGMNFENTAVINGTLDSHINGEIYLIDIARKDVIKDSTKIIDGKFNFTYKAGAIFQPFEARLCMWDQSNGIKYLRPIGFVNPYIEQNVESIFYVDRGTTSIEHKIKIDSHYIYEIKGSRQNEPYHKHLKFSDLNSNLSAAERKMVIASDLSLITKYPSSFYLMNLLYINRELYTSDELTLLMEGFSDDGKTLLPYNKLKAWITYKQKGKTYLPDIILENEKSVKEHVFDTTAKINMLVFWASWCGPCRSEIPNLKEIYLKYHTKGLTITSISLDNNERNWQSALTVEKMPWKQLITNDSAKNIFDLQYDISSIPVVVLIDAKKKLIQRFMGALPKEQYYRTLSILDK